MVERIMSQRKVACRIVPGSCTVYIHMYPYFYNPSFARSEELYNNNAGKIILPLPLLPLLLGPIYEFISKGGSIFSRVIYLEYITL